VLLTYIYPMKITVTKKQSTVNGGVEATVDGVDIFLFAKATTLLFFVVGVHGFGRGDSEFPFEVERDPMGIRLTSDPRLVLLALKERLNSWGFESLDLTKVEQDEAKARTQMEDLVDKHGYHIAEKA
jgi:hypothetical protein